MDAGVVEGVVEDFESQFRGKRWADVMSESVQSFEVAEWSRVVIGGGATRGRRRVRRMTGRKHTKMLEYVDERISTEFGHRVGGR